MKHSLSLCALNDRTNCFVKFALNKGKIARFCARIINSRPTIEHTKCSLQTFSNYVKTEKIM